MSEAQPNRVTYGEALDRKTSHGETPLDTANWVLEQFSKELLTQKVMSFFFNMSFYR